MPRAATIDHYYDFGGPSVLDPAAYAMALLHLDAPLCIILVLGLTAPLARTSIPALLLRHVRYPRPRPGGSIDRAYTTKMATRVWKSQGRWQFSVAHWRRSLPVFTDTGPRGTPARRLIWGTE